MIFKTLPAEVIKLALEGHKNIITPAVEELDRYFNNLSCPSCGGDCRKYLDSKRLFRENHLLPNYMAECKTCGVKFEPYTKIQISLPDYKNL